MTDDLGGYDVYGIAARHRDEHVRIPNACQSHIRLQGDVGKVRDDHILSDSILGQIVKSVCENVKYVNRPARAAERDGDCGAGSAAPAYYNAIQASGLARVHIFDTQSNSPSRVPSTLDCQTLPEPALERESLYMERV